MNTPLKQTQTQNDALSRSRTRLSATTAALMMCVSPLVLSAALMNTALVSTAHGQAVNLGGGTNPLAARAPVKKNNITIDGRTKTNIAVSGSTTKITTSTISGNTGFNSFNDFKQAVGTNVELYVPNKAGNLVNIVKGRIEIDGTLNSYKDGKIGGNIFFSSSQGMVVGKTGVVNVGSLHINTPTKEFLDKVIGKNGVINQAVANQLLRGEIPISKDGVISINGKINANGDISLQGHTVSINGKTGPLTGEDIGQRTKFNATVNAMGMEEGGALVSRNGNISIVSIGSTKISGSVKAASKTKVAGKTSGNVTIKSKGDISVTPNAQIVADGIGTNAAGGTIIVKAGGTLSADDGSFYSAKGTGSGDGGYVELSGKTAYIGGVQVDLSSENGRAGTLFIDPFDLYIGGTVADVGSSTDYSFSNNLTTNGGSVILEADNSITIVSAGFIDTRTLDLVGVTSGNSGDVHLTAPKVYLKDGSQILAGVDVGSGYSGGNITLTSVLTATSTTPLALFDGAALTEIVIGEGTGSSPILTGANITLSAMTSLDQTSLLLALPDATARITINSATITATGQLKATANANAGGGLTDLPIGIVSTNVDALTQIIGASQITAGSVLLEAYTSAESVIKTKSLFPSNGAADGAVAVSNVASDAVARIGGTSVINAANMVELTASSAVISNVDATPASAAFGASVAVSVVNANATAELTGDANLDVGALQLTAQTTNEINVNALAASGGAQEPQAGSQADKYLNDPEYGEDAQTSEGKVSAVGAFALSDLDTNALAQTNSTQAALVRGAVTIASITDNNVDVKADASTVDSKVGVGVALGINLVNVSNKALLSQAMTAGSISLSAVNRAFAIDTFKLSALSGAGASDVGVAGSLAVNLMDVEANASVAEDAALTLTGGDLTLTADARTDTTSEALPKEGGAVGGTIGVGASVGMNILANRAIAEIGNNATITDAKNVKLSANGAHRIVTKGEAGSKGGIAITPALGLSIVSNKASAKIGSGNLLVTTGVITVDASQVSSVETIASGDAAGEDGAIGAAMALAIINDDVQATTARDIQAGGWVRFRALGSSQSTLSAIASAAGGKEADEEGAPETGEKNVDETVTGELTSGSTKQKNAGVGDSEQQSATEADATDEESHSASTSGGKLAVAAAVGINVHNSTTQAAVPDGVNIKSAGALTLLAVNNTSGEVSADGTAVKAESTDGAALGVGVGVAINVVKTSNKALLGNGTHNLHGLNISALSLDVEKLIADENSTDTKDDVYVAIAASGAGAAKVGFAGSLALNLIDVEAQASILATSNLVLNSGDISLSADARTDSKAEALPKEGGAAGGTIGVGASVGMNILANRSVAEIENNAVITGAKDIALLANGEHKIVTKGEAGSSGGIALTPALGLSIINNKTTAIIGTGGALLSSGAVTLDASQISSVDTSASGEAAGEKAAVGAALALAIINDDVKATTGRNINATGEIRFTALGSSTSTLSATASASGGKAAEDDGEPEAGEKNVDETVTGEIDTGDKKQKSTGVGDTGQRTKTTTAAGDEQGRSAKTSEGKIAVAAAVGVNVHNSTTEAVVPNGVLITSGGAVTVRATNHISGSVTADGSAVKTADSDGAKVAIGVGVAINVIDKENLASIGAGAHSTQGLIVEAKQGLNGDGVALDTIFAKATSGAGGSKVGVAGSLALNIIKTNSQALVLTGAMVNLGAGNLLVDSEENMSAEAEAAPSESGAASGGSVGVGASVSLNILNTNTKSEVADGANLTNGGDITLHADSDISTTTKASAGAEGGVAIDASIALATLNEKTIARLGTGNVANVSGAVIVSASNIGSNEAESIGETKGGKIAVGASAAVILGSGDTDGVLSNTSFTSAQVLRNITADSLTISSLANRTYDAIASASAGGGKSSEDKPTENTTTGGTSTSGDTLDKTKDSQRDSKGKKNASKVTVAAAVGVAGAQDNVSATLGGVTVNIANAIDINATNTSGVATSGSGEAVDAKSSTSVGVGIGLGILNNKTAATISNGATVTNAGSISIAATSRENVEPEYMNRVTALGVAGAGSKGTSVAGAMAVGISTGDTRATIGDNVTITNAGAVMIDADNTSKLSARALAGAASSGGNAVGAAIAVSVSEKSYKAGIGSGGNIKVGSLAINAINRKVNAPRTFDLSSIDSIKAEVMDLDNPLFGANNYYAEAIGGAASSSSNAVQGSFAIMVFDDEVLASVGKSFDTSSITKTSINASTGKVDIKADNQFNAKALSGAISAGSSNGVGISGAIIVSEGSTTATLAENAEVTNASSLLISANAAQDVQAYGVSAAAAGSNAIAGVASVISTENTVEALVGINTEIAASGDLSILATNDFDTFTIAGGAAAGGSNGIGASGSVVNVKNITRAAVKDAASLGAASEIDAGGKLLIHAIATEDGEFIAAAGAAAGNVAVGAGLGVFNLDVTTEALIGNYAVIGSANQPTKVDLLASDITAASMISGAASAGGSVGAGAGVAVSVINKDTHAAIGSSANLKAGDVVISAVSEEDFETLAIGVAAGGSAGVGGAVSVFAVTTDTLAEIGSNAVVLSQGNAAVLANGHTSIDKLSGGAAAGGSAGIGASVGVSVISNTTKAKIGNSAQVTALAQRGEVNYIGRYDRSFTAYTDDFKAPSYDLNSSDIDAPAAGSLSNRIKTSDDARKTGFDLLTKKRNSVPIISSAKGVVVRASAANEMRELVVAGGIGGAAGVSLSASIPVLTNLTEATIGTNARINQIAGVAASDQSVAVSAASDFYSMDVAGSVAVGGSAGVGAGINVVVANNTTKANIGVGSVVAAQKDVIVSADAKADVVAAAIAGSAGGVAGIAGGVSTLVFDSTTTAELAGTTVAGGNVDVLANDITRASVLSGAIAGGGIAGVGAAVNVVAINKHTKSSIANGASVTAFGTGASRSILTGASFEAPSNATGVNVQADSGQALFALGVAGAGGLVGVGGVLSLELIDVSTEAFIGTNAAINTSAANAGAGVPQDVAVTARDTTATSVMAGGVAAGFVGVAGAIDIAVLKNRTSAYVGDNTTINANRNVYISALANRAGDSLAISAAGGVVGVAAGISIYSYGDGVADNSEAGKNLSDSSEDGDVSYSGVIGKANTQAQDNSVGTDILASSDDDDVKQINSDAQAVRNNISFTSLATPDPDANPLLIPAGTSASVGNATINSGGSLNVKSRDDMNVRVRTGVVAIGAVGAGAGIGVLVVDTKNTAKIQGNSNINTGGLFVNATTRHNLSAFSIVGSGGLAAAISADVAVVVDSAETAAFIDGQTITVVGGGVSIVADATRNVEADGIGAGIGLLGSGVGASVATAIIDGKVEAGFGKRNTIGTIITAAPYVTVSAITNDRADSSATAAAGGLGAGISGSASVSKLDSDVTLTVDGADITSSGAITIGSAATGVVKSDAIGVAVAGGLAVGASLALSEMNVDVHTDIKGNSQLNGNSIDIGSGSTTSGVTAKSLGAAGALIGLNATIADAKNTSKARATMYGGTLEAAGAISVHANNTSNQLADASGLAVGLIAAGANFATAKSETATHALITNMAKVDAGSLNILASGSDNNEVKVVAGSGGLVAGAAAEGETSAVSETTALIATNNAAVEINTHNGSGSVVANHTTRFQGKVDSTQASAIGASSADLEHTVSSTVNAGLGNSTKFRGNDLIISAQNSTINNFLNSANPDSAGFNVDSGSGGLINVPAGAVKVNVTHTTAVNIGQDSDIHLLADVPASNLSLLQLDAYSNIKVQQKSKLDSGGLIALAASDIVSNFTAATSVNIGANSDLIVDLGEVKIAAAGEADIDLRSSASTYGLAGAPSGKANITYVGTNNVNIAGDVLLEASRGIIPVNGDPATFGTIDIYSGRKVDGTKAKLDFFGGVDLFNNTAIPISGAPDPRVFASNNATINIATTANDRGIRASGDIQIKATRGDISAEARGIGKNIYLEIASKVASAVSNLFGGGDISFDLTGGTSSISGVSIANINGQIHTGLERTKSLTLDYVDYDCNPALPATCLANPVEGEIGYSVSGPDAIGTNILDRIGELEVLKVKYQEDLIAREAYNSEIRFLQKKLVLLGLGSFDGTDTFIPNAFVGTTQAFLDGQVTTQSTEFALAKDDVKYSSIATVTTDTIAFIKSVYDSGYNDATYGLNVSATSTITELKKLSNYAPGTYEAAAEIARVQGKAAADSIKAATDNNILREGNITALSITFNAAQDALKNALKTGSASQITTANNNVATQKGLIDAELAAIKTNNDTIIAQTAIARARAITVKFNLSDLYNSIAVGSYAASDADQSVKDAAIAVRTADSSIKNALLAASSSNPAANGFLTSVRKTADLLAAPSSDQSGYLNSSNSQIATLRAAASTVGSLAAKVSQLNQVAGKLAGAENAQAAGPSDGVKTYKILVDDVSTRLANIIIEADQLNGNGVLDAPGDASITVNNKTAHTLVLQNMTIPDTSTARVTFNDVMVNSKEDINAINVSRSGANFTAIRTSDNTSRGKIKIASKYNDHSTLYYDSESTLGQKNHAFVAPDIILKADLNPSADGGYYITNRKGAVEIDSAAGNIYINGSIRAGSVSIVARKGDFVSSYVNGFNHIGGDPSGFKKADRAGEAGKGIVANGSVNISARYLNINSTIQSGIVDLTLDIKNSTKLTADAGAIGVDTAALDLLVKAYQDSIAAGGNPDTSTTIAGLGGQNVVVNFLPEGFDSVSLKAAITAYLDDGDTANPLRSVLVDGVSKTVNIRDFISGEKVGRLEFTVGQADAYAVGERKYALITPNDSISALYNAASGQYEVDGTSVNGGLIQVFGQILNTASSGGQLNVLDGFGTINIKNETNRAVVLSSLDTGDDLEGTLRGTKGIIDITDVRKLFDGSGGEFIGVLRTVYSRDYDPANASGDVQIRTQVGTIRDATGIVYTTDNTVSSGNDRNSTYNPLPEQRYVFTTREDFNSSSTFKNSSTELFGSSDLSVANITSLEKVTGPLKTSSDLVKDGYYVTTDKTQIGENSANFVKGLVAVDSNPVYATNASVITEQYKRGETSYLTEPTAVTSSTSTRSCNWWTLCVVSTVTTNYTIGQKYKTIITESLKADNPIAINFIGENAGTIDVQSAGDVIINNTIRNVAGATTISAGDIPSQGGFVKVANKSIIQGKSSGLILSKSVDLDATGYIGGIDLPVGAALEGNSIAINLSGAGGFVNANAASGNVSMISRNDINVGDISASGLRSAGKGDVTLVAYGSIKGVTSNSKIQAPKVSLTALSGSITGSTAGEQLTVNTGFVDADRVFGDPELNAGLNQNPEMGLNATAIGDILIKYDAGGTPWAENVDGHMLVDQVRSLGGDVHLSAPGQILDNHPAQSVDSRTYNELLGYWDSLGLVEGTAENAKKVDLAVTAFENSQTKNYDQYWQTRQEQADGGVTYDASYVAAIKTDVSKYPELLTTYEARVRSESTTPLSDVEVTQKAQKLLDARIKNENTKLDVLKDNFETKVRADQPLLNDAKVATAVDLEISKYELQRTNEYHDGNVNYGGLTLAYDGDYRVTATPDQEADIRARSSWTKRQLALSLSAGALKTVTGTNIVVKEANVSGYNVTLDAGFGIGETIGAKSGPLGVTIRADIDPSNLTLDQKVALAAAERSDLLLTVGPVNAPGPDATQSQLDAYADAVALGLDVTGSSTTIELGQVDADNSTMTNVQLAAFNAAAAGLISQSDTVIKVLSKRPLNFSAATALNVSVAQIPNGAIDQGTINVASRGDVALGNITSKGEARIKVRGNITNAAVSNIATGNLILEASQGAIGSLGSSVNLNLPVGSTTTARAQNGIYLNFVGNGLIDTIYSPKAVNLTAAGSLLNANNDLLINVLGDTVKLKANSGSIGTSLRSLNVASQLDGGIDAEADDEINLYGPSVGEFVIKRAIAGGTINLTGSREATIDGLVETASDININSAGRQILTQNANVHSVAGDVNVVSAALKILNYGKINADLGRVDITTDGDALVTGIKAGSAALNAVSVKSGGEIFAGTLDPRTDIKTTTIGAGVLLEAASGIGARLQANAKAVDGEGDVVGSANKITDLENLLVIGTANIDAKSTVGDIALKALNDIVSSTMKADSGGIKLVGDGSLHVNSAISTGAQLIEAQNNVVFETLETSTSAGDVTVKAITGTVAGGSINSGGSINIFGNGVKFKDIIAAKDSTVTSMGDIIGDSQIAGESIVDEAGSPGVLGSIKIGLIRGKDMKFDATGDLDLGNVEVSDKIDLTANNVKAKIKQVPSGPLPLQLILTGSKGSVGTSGDISVDAPAGLTIASLKMTDSVVSTTANNVEVLDAFVPGTFRLAAPKQELFFNNRTPLPQSGSNVQFFDPDFAFSMALNNFASSSSAFVVQYDVTAQSTDVLLNDAFKGISFIRDTVRNIEFVRGFGGSEIYSSFSSEVENDQWEDQPIGSFTINNKKYSIRLSGRQVAVNLGDGEARLAGVEF